MRNMREQVSNMGEKMNAKIVNGIGEASIKLGEQAREFCFFLGFYEPKIPMELLGENIENVE